MVTKENISRIAYQVGDEELKRLLFDSVSVACRMIVPTTKDEHVLFFIETSIIRVIRKMFNDFTVHYLDSAIEAGAYGYYGTYTKINGALIIAWLQAKRIEISKDLEDIERKEAQNRREKHVLAETNGGFACLLMLYYYEKKLPEVPRDIRLKLVNENGICPNTGKRVNDLISTYLKQK